MIRVVIVDDQEMVRVGLRTLAEHDGDIEVIAEAADGQVGIVEVGRARPDVVLMDIRMPRLDGIAATRAIVGDERLSEVRVVMLTTFGDERSVLEAIRAGASGYLLKDLTPTALREAIRTVAGGDALLDPAVTRSALAHVVRAANAAPRPEMLDG